MNTFDLDALFYARDLLLTNPNVIADDVYLITRLAMEDYPLYRLMMAWVSEEDAVEREELYEDMLYRKKSLYNVVSISRSS